MKKSTAIGLSLGVFVVGTGVATAVHFGAGPKQGINRQAAATSSPAATQWWTCSMHRFIHQDHPGDCPICHMRLTAVREGGAGGTVVVDPAVVLNMGIRTALVTTGPITKSVRTVGMFEAPETGLYDISPKVGGWIDKLYADQDGQHVHEGEPLFDLYSPDLTVAGQELVGVEKSLRAIGAMTDESVKRSAESMVASAKQKLRLLDVSETDIAGITEKLTVPRTFTFRSPASGAVIDKAVVQGTAVTAGQKLMRIEDHSTVWLQLQVYEDQFAAVAVGQEVRATVEAFPRRTFAGKVTFIHPHVDPMSRTVMARVVVENPDALLHPGMYASAVIETAPVANATQVPREAVIDTGTSQTVFVALPEGHFEPRHVHAGVTADDGRVQILDGLAAGESVVTSGEFLIDAESRTQEAIAKLRSPEAKDPAEMMMTTAPVAANPAEVLTVAYCPMKKREWIQRGSVIANPFFGTSMATCGDVRRTVPMPAESSRIVPVVKAYLRVEEGLAADKFDKGASDDLEKTSEQLADPRFATVRSKAAAVDSAADVSEAHAALIPLSEALIRAIEPMPATVPSTDGGRP